MQVRCYSEITVIAQICCSCCRAVLGLEGFVAKQTQGFVLNGCFEWLVIYPFSLLLFSPSSLHPHPYFSFQVKKVCGALGTLGSTYLLLQGFFGFTWQGKEGGTARETLPSFPRAVSSNNNDSSFSWRSGLQACPHTSYSLGCGGAILEWMLEATLLSCVT